MTVLGRNRSQPMIQFATWATSTKGINLATVEDKLRIANWQQGIQIIGLSPRAMRARVINQVVPHERQAAQVASSTNNKPLLSDPTEVIYAVQQPDGEKVQAILINKSSRATLKFNANSLQ